MVERKISSVQVQPGQRFFLLAVLSLSACTPQTELLATEPTVPIPTQPSATPTETAVPISSHAQEILETFRASGREIVIEGNLVYEVIDSEKVELLEAQGETIIIQGVLGTDGETVKVDASRLELITVGGYEKLYITRDEDGQGYMWRTPWGGWVEDRDKIFTENTVSIIANESELYGGLFTINPSLIEETWTKLVTSIYHTNLGTSRTICPASICVSSLWASEDYPQILTVYPDEGSFLIAASEGFVFDNLRVIAEHPNKDEHHSLYGATWVELDNTTISAVKLSIAQLSPDEVLRLFAYPKGFPGASIGSSAAHLTIEPYSINDTSIPHFVFVKAQPNDMFVRSDGEQGSFLGISPLEDPEKIHRSIVEVINSYYLKMRVVSKGQLAGGFVLYDENFDEGPLFKLLFSLLAEGEILHMDEVQDLSSSPFVLLQ